MSNLNNFNFTDFNKLIEQAKQAVMCDSNCQKEKTAQELKEKYLASQQNLLSAGSQEVEAKKNYVVFTQGELAYNNQQQDDLHTQAQLIVNKFNENFNTYLQQIKLQIDSYNGLIVNFKNVVELYIKYKEENKILTQKVKDNSSDVLTNDRNITHITDISFFPSMVLWSSITDFYTIMRMFQKFNVKENTTNTCNRINTPENILVYSGLAHTHKYVDFLNIFFDCVLKIDNEEYIKYDNHVHIEHKTINELNINSFDDLIRKFTS
jgi:hypothetical protein